MNGNKVKTVRIFSILFVLCSLLLASCPSPFEADFDSSPVDTLPPGMGSFSLSISSPQTASRTVLPETNPDMEYFDKLELVFTAVDGGAATKNVTVYTYEGNPLPEVVLQAGQYSLTVDAYFGTDLLARGTLSSVVINEGANTSETVVLKLLLSVPDTKGNFSWNITLVPDINAATASITITPLTDGGTPAQTIAFTSAGYRSLNSGPYNVTFYFEQISDGVIVKTLKWSEYVHVYPTLNSVFKETFTDAHFNSTRYTVTFVPNSNQAGWTQSILHGGTVQPPNDLVKTSVAYLYLGTPPANPGFTFGGWYTDSTFTSAWNTGTLIISDTNLYAKWTTDAIDVSGQTGPNDVEKAIAYVNTAANAAAGAYTLLVGEDVIISQRLTLDANNTKLTIEGIGGMRTLSLSSTVQNNLFTVGWGGSGRIAELTIGNNITLEGHSSNNNTVVIVQGGAMFTMLDGSRITGNSNSTSYVSLGGGAAAVYVINGGVFTMEGGQITGNTSSHAEGTSGVYAGSNGIFNMKGGSISGNTARYGDVSINHEANSFTLSGNAAVGNIALVVNSASATTTPTITVSPDWSGSVGILNLVMNTTSIIDQVITFWENKTVLQGAGLNAAIVAKFTLGNFIGNNSATPQSIANTHDIESSGPDIGKLLKRPFDLYAAVAAFSGATGDLTVEIPENITMDKGNITIPANPSRTLTITSASGGSYTISRGQQDTLASNGLFIVPSGARLVFQNIVIDGNKTTYTGNTASLVRVNSGGTLTLNSGAVLKNNSAANGGAVYLNGVQNNTVTFTMNAGSKISGNTASTNGGGVFNVYGTVVMNGGEISGNAANTRGGGIYFQTISGIRMSGGEISGNFAPTGGGVYFEGGGGSTLTVGGTAVISENTVSSTSTTPNNVYLPNISANNSTYITIGNGTNNVPAPASGMSIYVQTVTNHSGVIVDTGATATNVQYFHADEAGKTVVLDGVQLKLMADPNANTNGTSAAPFKVYDAATLGYVGKGTANPAGYQSWTPDKYYEQTADINTTTFTPIGSFTGTFDGGGYTITGLTNSLFSGIGSGGTVKTLGLVNVNISGSSNVGAIAGSNSGTVQNCYVVTGSVTGTGQNVGGIVGNSTANSKVENCYAAVTVTGTTNVGGIVGNNAGNVQYCFSLNEKVTATTTGGLVGRITGNGGTLTPNSAWEGVIVNGTAPPTNDVAPASKNGESISTNDVKTEGKWQIIYITSNIWVWNGNSGMPSFNNSSVQPWPF